MTPKTKKTNAKQTSPVNNDIIAEHNVENQVQEHEQLSTLLTKMLDRLQALEESMIPNVH